MKKALFLPCSAIPLFKRTALSLLAVSLVSVVLPTTLVAAQSQNEVITTVLYDGTTAKAFGDAAGSPTPTGTAPEAHTPGEDAGANNLVVRTHDQFAIRVDWNINEADATNVVLETVLPAFAEWTVDDSLGYSGCEVTSFAPNAAAAGVSVTNSQTVTCELGDQPQGSNGAIRMTALLNENLDSATFDVLSTLTTDDDVSGNVVDGLDQLLTVSEAPLVDYIKHAPEVFRFGTADDADAVLLFPLSFNDYSQGDPIIGVGPILDASDIPLEDHMWNLTPNARLATAQEMTDAGFAGTNCGNYAAGNGGAFIDTTVATAGTWTCGAVSTTLGYPTVPITVADFVSRPFPTTLLNGAPNGVPVPQITAGQIAIFLDGDEIKTLIEDENSGDSETSALLENALVDAGNPVIVDSADIVDATGFGTGGTETNNGNPANNNADVTFGIVPSDTAGPGAAIYVGHDIRWSGGPLQLSENLQADGSYIQSDLDSNVIPGTNARRHYSPTSTTTNIGEVSRGQTLTLGAYTSVGGSASEGTEVAIHQCIALDTSHYNVVALPTNIPVRENAGDENVIGFSTTGASNGIVHVETGEMLSFNGRTNGVTSEYAYGVGGDAPDWGYEVQVASGPIPAVGGQTGIGEDGLTCNGDGIDWVAATGDLSQFDVLDAQGNAGSDGLYEGIQRVRVISTELGEVALPPADPFSQGAWGWGIYLNVQVLQDLDVNSNGQELFAFTSNAYDQNAGWDGSGALPEDLNCRPWQTNGSWNNPDKDGSGVVADSGWCSNEFLDEGASDGTISSFDDTDAPSYDSDTQSYNSANQISNVSGTLVEIVGASLGLSKTNNDGLTDIANNGDEVTFTIRPTVVGATVEALTNVRVVDQLPANYEYVSHTQPTTPGSSCTFNASTGPQGAITCQYSQANPNSPDGSALPLGLAGGWPNTATGDSAFEVTVVVTGAIANPDQATVLTNEATVDADQLAAWDPDLGDFIGSLAGSVAAVTSSANSYMPLPADEGAIIKAVDTLEGPCDTAPSSDPTIDLAAWADRCSQIDLDGNMSFVLSLENEGNTAFTDIEIIDVFPWNGDGPGSEPASETLTDVGIPDGSPNTVGDGRTPPSAFNGTLGFVSMDPVANATGLVTYVTGDDSDQVSRDPLTSFTNDGNTWCDGIGGAIVNGGSGGCPATADAVTATYSYIPGDLNPGQTLEIQLTLDSQDVNCTDVWTNTFGTRVDQIFLPIRSNDVSIMVNCEYDLALEKTIDPAFTPAADWLTPGTSTVDFLIEVTNQGDPVEDFHVTDYVDTAVFEFTAANNANGTTTGDEALPFTWDLTDPAAPVAQIDGALGTDDSVFIPVTLIVTSLDGPLENWAEISYFDNDGDPSNGDSLAADPANPTNLALADEDSTPDGDQANDVQPAGFGEDGDGVIDGDGTGFAADGTTPDLIAGDEDDHDVAGLPFYDLELVKTLASFDLIAGTVTFEVTVTNQGTGDAFLVDVIEYPPAGLLIDVAETNAGLPAGTTFDGTALFTIAGPIEPDASVTIPVTFTIDDLSGAPFTNTAEIAGFDVDDDPSNDASPLAIDVDSTPDTINDDELIDHTEPGYDPDGDGDLNEATPGDEDDHDIAVFAPPVEIGNYVWIDANNDGVQDPTETPVEGVVVNLLDANGDPVLDDNGDAITTTTDANGEYSFTVVPGQYIVEFDLDTLPDGFIVTSQDTGAGDDTDDSDADPTTGQTGIIDVTDLSGFVDTDGDGIVEDFTWDMGIVETVRIGNFVWLDSDNNGVQDGGEAPVEGVIVNLLDANGDPVLDENGVAITTVTDANGEYYFDVVAGDYMIEFDPASLPANTEFTLAGQGDDATGSDADPATGRTAPFSVDPATAVDTDGDGIKDDYTHDAGIYPPIEIGNFVWIDANNDGVQDPTETPVEGVVVNLLDANGDPVLDVNGDAITTTTDANGEYVFAVPPGMYIVEFDLDTLPDDYTVTLQDSGSDDEADSDGDPITGQTGVIDVSDVTTLTDSDGDGRLDDYSYDLGIVPPVRIGNFVWIDADGDGVQDPGEVPVEGVVVNLLDADGNPVLDENGEAITTTTDANGEYYFDVAPGMYIVEFDLDTLPDNYVPTTPGSGADGGADSNADPATGQTGVIDVSDVTTLTDTDGDGLLDDYTWDMGIVPLVEIGNYVWIDANSDGVQDATETPVEGVVVNLLDANGDPVLDDNGDAITTTTDANGEYSFTVVPGEYIVEFDLDTLPAGFVPTSHDSGADDAADSDADRVTGLTAVIDVSDPSPFVDTDGDGIVEDFTWDMGIVELVRIGNLVWLDSDNNGVQDGGEAPVEGVIVNLLDANGDPALDLDGNPITTVTDANGEYYFDVPAGEYIVEFDPASLPANTEFTLAGQGDDATGSDADPATGRTAPFSVDPATAVDTDGDGIKDDYTHDAGIYPPIEIGNFVWIDANNDGIQDPTETPVEGVVVNLLDADGNPVLDVNGDAITTTTDANGEYSFLVPPGMYIVEFDLDTLPEGFNPTITGAGNTATDSDADALTGWTGVIDVSDPSVLTDTDGDGVLDDLTWDMGIVETVRIGNYVWFDSDSDGIQDVDEDPVAGVLVELLDADGNPVLDANGDPITATTNADGFYEFNVFPGDYQLQFTPPAGMVTTTGNAGDDDAADSDADPFGRIPTFTVERGMDDFTLDVGLVETQLISGVIWEDDNQDGIQDSAEAVRANVLVELFDGDGNPVLDVDGNPVTALTNADGYYEFPVPPGDYRLRFTPPTGTGLTPGSGADDDVDANGLTEIITVVAGVDVPGIDAGIVVTESAPPLAFTGVESMQLFLMAWLAIGAGMAFTLVGRLRNEEHA